MLYTDSGSQRFITVTQFNNYIKAIFRAEELLQGVLVFGEISGWKISGPHAYFTLKDDENAVSCNCFNYSKMHYLPGSGESVLIKGSADYYGRTGKLSINVTQIEPVGKGALYQKLEQLKAKLAAEGLFDEALKKPLPSFPRNVCILTGRSGAVIHDICRTVRLKNNAVNLYLKDVRVQGDGAHLSIIEALKSVDKMGFDVLIIARGGGSQEDLACFNEEALARQIVLTKTPVVSAVGHESDYSICDFVADVRAATPTAAAQLVAYDQEELKNTLDSFVQFWTERLNGALKEEKRKLLSVNDKLCAFAGLSIEQQKGKLSALSAQLSSNMQLAVQRAEHLLSSYALLLENNNPLAVLRRGYYALETTHGEEVDLSALRVGDTVRIIGDKGSAEAAITKTGLPSE